MKYKRIADSQGNEHIVGHHEDQWNIIEGVDDVIELLSRSDLSGISMRPIGDGDYRDLIPFKPAAYRDFMLYEKHAIDAARGFVKKYMSGLLPVVRTYEKITGKTFPKLKPKERYYKYPIHYMGNHLNIGSEGDEIAKPSYTAELDYELEIGAVITKPLKNATAEEARDAIGGFVILNDFSARDVQLDEMNAGFGPMKTKNFGSSISAEVASAKDLLSRIDKLKVKVIINGETIIESTSEGKLYSFEESIAYASWEEQLHPGELFGSGTIPGCTGIENGVMLSPGDTITLEVEGIGQLTNPII